MVSTVLAPTLLTRAIAHTCPSSVLQHAGPIDPHDFEMGVAGKRGKATFGHADGTLKPKPSGFLKKHSGEPVLPPRKCWHSPFRPHSTAARTPLRIGPPHTPVSPRASAQSTRFLILVPPLTHLAWSLKKNVELT